MPVYTYECSYFKQISGQNYIIIKARKKGNIRDELVLKYDDYCFIFSKKARELALKYKLRFKKGYKDYKTKKAMWKVYFPCRNEMKKILSYENIEDANFVDAKSDFKALLDLGIKYKFFIKEKKRPLEAKDIRRIITDDIDDTIEKTIYCDIEVDSEDDLEFPTGDKAIHPVISASFVCPGDDLYWICLDETIEQDVEEEIMELKDGLIYPNGKEVVVRYYKYEKDMMYFFGDIQKRYDSMIMAGWNFKRFDYWYLINRCKMLKISPKVLFVSDYVMYKKVYKANNREDVDIYTSDSYILDGLDALLRKQREKYRYNGLNDVSARVLGDEYGKYDMEMSIAMAWKKNKKKLMFYNVIDSVLVKLIDQKIGLFRFFELRRKKRGLCIADVFSTLKPITASLCYFAEEVKVALPDSKYNKPSKLKGADVHTAPLSVFDWVVMLDFKSEYPSIIASSNCSASTIVEDPDLQMKLEQAYGNWSMHDNYDPESKPEILKNYTISYIPDDLDPQLDQFVFFNNEEDSFDRKFVMKNMIDRENYFKKKNQYQIDSLEYNIYDEYENDVKLDGNSLYGAYGNQFFILSNYKIANSITSTARILLDEQRNYIIGLGYPVAISDTDSADFGIMKKRINIDEAIAEGYSIEEKLKNHMNDFTQTKFLFGTKNGYFEGFDLNKNNTDTHWIYAKFEKLYGPMLTTGKKKRYACKLVWKDGKKLNIEKYDIKGFQCVKRDSMLILKTVQETVIKKILNREDRLKIIKYIHAAKKFISKAPLLKLSKTANYKNRLENYKSVAKGYLPPLAAQAMANAMVNFGIQFELFSRFNYVRIKRIKSGKYDKSFVNLRGKIVKFKQDSVAFNKEDELPKDFFDYFRIDEKYVFDDVILKQCEDLLKVKKINPIIFSGQTLLTAYS